MNDNLLRIYYSDGKTKEKEVNRMSKYGMHNKHNKKYTFADTLYRHRDHNESEKKHKNKHNESKNKSKKMDSEKQVTDAELSMISVVEQMRQMDHPFKLNKKKLTDDEIAKYKSYGKPDLTQNWLELFLPDLIDDLFTIMNYGSDNYEKANYVVKELEDYGFYAVGEGTNIIVLENPHYPGVVYKIALDSNGIADNFNDEILQHRIPRYGRVYARHSSGIVSVQERYVVMDKYRMKDFKNEIIDLLKELSSEYLIADLSPARFLNFGVARDGGFVIIDGSDLYPLDMLDNKPRCQDPTGWDKKKGKMLRCGGKLEYSVDYLSMICKKCGKEINALELRPKEKDGDANMASYAADGISPERRQEMEAEELEVVRRRLGQSTIRVEKQIISSKTDDSSILVESDDVEEDEITVTEELTVIRSTNTSTSTANVIQKMNLNEEEEDDPDDDGDDHIVLVRRGSRNLGTISDEVTEKNPDVLRIENILASRCQWIDSDTRVNISASISSMISLLGNNAANIMEQIISGDDAEPEVDRQTYADTIPHDLTQLILASKINPTKEAQQKIIDGYTRYVKETVCVVEDDMNGPDHSEQDDTPHINYRIIPYSKSTSDAGIYLDIVGDFDDAWDESGLPVYVSVTNGMSYDIGVRSTTLKLILDKVIPDLISERDNPDDEDD